jgi:hypothetical protein
LDERIDFLKAGRTLRRVVKWEEKGQRLQVDAVIAEVSGLEGEPKG